MNGRQPLYVVIAHSLVLMAVVVSTTILGAEHVLDSSSVVAILAGVGGVSAGSAAHVTSFTSGRNQGPPPPQLELPR